jgi:RING-like zinc finger/PA domain
MRPPRLLIFLFCFVTFPILLTLLSVFTSHHKTNLSAKSSNRQTGVGALFSFFSPSSLFPPSAIISLTDDNSTFFLARPAAFGPILPSKGLSGELWVGSGFGADGLRKGELAAVSEGELGCSDVPGWGEGETPGRDDEIDGVAGSSIVPRTSIKKDHRPSANGENMAPSKDVPEIEEIEDDGTDDYLHAPLTGTSLSNSPRPKQGDKNKDTIGNKPAAHADIQSLQEMAEITGKVVLLSRGGCGFLEKVMWVQRRGGSAVIVGDDIRRGRLVTMYARGDTTNVSIPSLFTSHTTAHLLSTLIPPTSISGHARAGNLEFKGKGVVSGQTAKKGEKIHSKATVPAGPTFTAKIKGPKSTPGSRSQANGDGNSRNSPQPYSEKESHGWLDNFLSSVGLGPSSDESGVDSRRPPSSGELDWVLAEVDVSDPSKPNDQIEAKDKPVKASQKSHTGLFGVTDHDTGDDFVIGEQDWRDPDLVGPKAAFAKSKDGGKQPKKLATAQTQPKTPLQTKSSVLTGTGVFNGGSTTPGSGEYEHTQKGSTDASRKNSKDANGKSTNSESDTADGWLSLLPMMKSGTETPPSGGNQPGAGISAGYDHPQNAAENWSDNVLAEQEHEGLWVTLTATSMSTSPFFDTLLVLVVSPLVTLTVVYTLLLLRARIRRRRWRAPKSVVERLPVRVYQTMSTPGPSTPRFVPSSSSSPSAPLLSASAPVPSRSRQRSQTTSDLQHDVLRARAVPARDTNADSEDSETEKFVSAIGSPTPKPKRPKRYNGHQVECVVCLEEYVDGISRVMRLPCGHEFHAACM